MQNRFSLSDLIKGKKAKSKKPRRKKQGLDPIKPSKKTERAYFKALTHIVAEAAKATRSFVLPAVEASQSGGGAGQTTAALDGLKTLLVRITPNVAGIVTNLLGKEAERHTEVWIDSVESATGIDIRPVVTQGDIADEFAMMIRRNVRLIDDLSDDVYQRIERSVTDAVINGTRPEALRKVLTEQLGITQRRAKLIARDQTAKAVSDLNQLRQEQAGIDRYIWSCSMDERVRGNPQGKYPHVKYSHWAREGKVIRWDNPPPDGHPGKPVNCRCVARAFIDLSED